MEHDKVDALAVTAGLISLREDIYPDADALAELLVCLVAGLACKYRFTLTSVLYTSATDL